MFRKRRRVSPHFKVHPPFHPIHGEQANLRQDGTAPYCAMMQIAAEDTYDDYVICRGFDPRILKFIDYEAGNADKPGISVAKPFGKRMAGTYEIAEVYPALLPTQGNDVFADFRQVPFVPPSPVNVLWRVGQNPGVVDGGLEGGQPQSLDEEIAILYDHNEKVVSWLLFDNGCAIASFLTPSGGIAARTGSTLGNAVCTRYALNGGTRVLTSHTHTVYNVFGGDIQGNVTIIAAFFDGIWVALAEDCSVTITPVAPTILEHTTTGPTYTFGDNLEEYLFVDASSNSVVITLTNTETLEGIVIVKDIAAGNTVSFAEQLSGQTVVLTDKYASIRFTGNAAGDYYIV